MPRSKLSKIPTLGNPCGSANPCHSNPWEVRSDSGLEGIYADEGEAHAEADNLRQAGVPGVSVDRREKATRPRPPRFPSLQQNPSEWQVDRSVTNMRDNLEIFGGDPFKATSYFKHIGVDVDGVGYGWLQRCYADTCLIELTDGRVEAFPTSSVWPVAGRYPESPTLLTLRAGYERNPTGGHRLFIGTYPTGIVYADRHREVDGDYARVAFLPYSSLRLQWSAGNIPAELRELVENDANGIIARRGQPFEVSSSGQTVILGGEQRRSSSAPPQYHERQGRPPGVPNPGQRVLREKWGDSSEIVVEHNRHGISGWLESKRGGGRMPISFGAARPDTLREAMDLAKKFLRGVHGKSNPARRR